MALRAMYKGFKKVLAPLIINRPGVLAIDQDAINTELNTVFFPRSEQAVLGAVNEFNNTATTDTVGGIECTVNADKTVTASGTYSGGAYVQFSLGRVSVKAGEILKGCPSGGSTSTYQLILFNSAQTARLATDLGEGAVISADDSNALLAIYFHASVTDKVFKPQICLSMDTPYAPYAMTNKELTYLGLVYRGAIPSGADLDDYVEVGMWDINGTNPTNLPTGASGYVPFIVFPRWGHGNIKQIIISRANEIYLRNKNDGESWSSWYKFTGTEVT